MPDEKQVEPIWTLGAYISHNEAMRAMQKEFLDERDRRYTEVNVAKEKALQVKETADLAALTLARESQLYKDQQADIMRDKNLAASGVYATQADLQSMLEKINKSLKPLFDYVNTQQGTTKGIEMTKGQIIAAIGTLGVIVGIIVKFM